MDNKEKIVYQTLEVLQAEIEGKTGCTKATLQNWLQSLKTALPDVSRLDPRTVPALRELRDQLQKLPKAAPAEEQNIKTTVGKIFGFILQRLRESCPSLAEPPAPEPRTEPVAALAQEIPQAGPVPHAEAPPSPEIDETAAVTLDDLSSLLIQTEPGDLDSARAIQKGLRSLKAQYAGNRELESALESAAGLLNELLTRTAAQPDNILTQVGNIMESAAKMLEKLNFPEKQTPAPPVAPAEPAPPAPAPQKAAARPPQEPPPSDEPEEFFLPADCDKDLLDEFINESKDYVAASEASLLNLETNPQDIESVNTIFRAFHTIKGTSAFMGLTLITELAHKAENLLSRMRNREILCSGGYADLALRSADMIKSLLDSTKEALSGKPIRKPEAYNQLLTILANPEEHGVTSEDLHVEVPRLGDLLVAQGKVDREVVEQLADQQGAEPIGVTLVKTNSASATDVAQAIRTQQRIAAGREQMPAQADSSVRVRTDRLDKLIDTVGELVIAQSMVWQESRLLSGEYLDLARKIGHTGKIVRELQDMSMSMRMVPLKPTFQKLARLVRDLGHKSGKQAQFITEGEDTEIDRNMVDYVGDPLVHMVRNSLDHGLEPPEQRLQSGKPAQGTVRLAAYHSGGNVVLELSDDGRGLNRDKIMKKAIANGLIESEKGMSDSDIYGLIFAPGFSTAEQITDISGRGVGMDVVRRNIEALRGHIDISTEMGRGTTFTVRLPLTLAITDGMLVRVGAERFIVPIVNIHMSFRPDPKSISSVTGRGEMVLLRGQLIPIYRIYRLFELKGAYEDFDSAILMIVDDGDKRCALMVDELLGQQQVVAKPLGDGIGKIQGISGGAILGDGRVGLILDPAEVAALYRQVGNSGM